MRKSLTFIFLVFSSCLLAQEFSLSGNIRDSRGNAVGYANVLVLRAADSTLVSGTITEEAGDYEFQQLTEGRYIIKASFVGLREKFSEPFELRENRVLPDLIMEVSEEFLDEVTVTARKPTIQRKIDRLVYNVENTVVSSGNTFDILKRTPGVIVNQGEILIKNRKAQVYINDRKVYLTNDELNQLLEGFSGENVKSVEVITTPPSNYDAEGGAILNIVTSKNISIGYKGSLNASNTTAVVPKYTAGTSQYFKNNWLNAFAAYNYNDREDYKKDDSRIQFFDNGSPDDEWITDFSRNTETVSHSLNTILDFKLSPKNSLSLSANLQHTPRADSDIDGITEIFNASGGALDSLFRTDSRLENERTNLLFNLNYEAKLGDNGASLTANANYIKFEEDQFQMVSTRYFSPQGNLLNANSFNTLPGQDSEIYTGQLDYSGNLGSWSFETGAKYSGIDSRSTQDFFDTESGTPQRVSALSDNFNYTEAIYASYFSFARDWEKWSFKAGLRGEYTDAEGNSLSLGVVNTQEYLELFPTVYLLHNPSGNHSFSANYSRRIDRPRFQSLNPFRYFLNENDFKEGNPDIRPAIADRIQFNYTFKNKLSFDLYWDRIDNAMAVLPLQDNQARIFRSVTDNLDFEQQYSLDVGYGDFLTDWWYFHTSASFFHMETQFAAAESGNATVNLDTDAAYHTTLNYFTFDEARTFSLTATTYFLSDIISGSYRFERPQFGLNIGLQKSFFKGRMVATVDAEDLFNTMNIPQFSRYLNQDNSFFGQPESRKVRFGLRYNFGNFRLSDNERPADAEERDRLKELEINH